MLSCRVHVVAIRTQIIAYLLSNIEHKEGPRAIKVGSSPESKLRTNMVKRLKARCDGLSTPTLLYAEGILDTIVVGKRPDSNKKGGIL